jgi:hypothetical protein
MEDQLVIESATPRGTFGDSQYLVKTNQGDFYYVPTDYVNRGYATDQYQYYNPEFLDKDFLNSGKRVNLDPSILEGKSITSSFENPNSGYLFKAEDFEKKIPTTAYYHELGEGEKQRRISGISQVPTASGGKFVTEEGLKYLLEGGGDQRFSFIRPDTTITTRTLSVTYDGIFGSRVAEALAKGAQAIGKVPFLTELTAAIPVVGPAVYGTIKGAQAGAAGKGPLEAATEIGLSLAAMNIAKGLLNGPTGAEVGGVPPGPGVEVFPVAPPAELGVTPIAGTPAFPTPDYSLTGGFPSATPGMGGGTGITPGIPGEGLQVPTVPSAPGMGGGTGLTVPVEGGTVGAGGFTPIGAVPVLGDPKSFINNPDVLGTPVMGGAAASGLSVMDALRGARLVNSLLNPPQQPGQQQPIGDAQGMGATGIDYNALLGLLNQRASAAGLLGTRFQPQSINLASLLG